MVLPQDAYDALVRKKHGDQCDPRALGPDPAVIYDGFGGMAHGRPGFLDSVLPRDVFAERSWARRQMGSSSTHAQLQAQQQLIEQLTQQNELHRKAEEERIQAEQRKQAEVERKEQERDEKMAALQAQNAWMYQQMLRFQMIQPQVIKMISMHWF